VVPSFLFTIGTVTGVIVTFLTFLRLTGYFLAFCISLEHGLHEGHILVAPKLLVGLLGLSGLTCCSLKGLAVSVLATTVQGVMHRERTAMGLALLAELLTATLFRDLTSWSPGRFALRVTLGFGWGCTALCLCFEVHTSLFFHHLLYSFQVR
jgi:hypothetical protein